MKTKHLTHLVTASAATAQTITLADMLASQNATLSILNGFLQQQQALFNTFSSASDITVLAPSNNALSSLPSSVLNQANTDPSYLSALLSYHVLNGTYYATNFSSSSSPSPLYIRTLLNSASYANVTGGQRIISTTSPSSGAVTFISGSQASSTLQTTDFNFTGGTVHIIDSMLSLPTNLTGTLLSANLTAAVGAISQSGLSASLDATPELTVFAPTNAAFESVGNLVAGMSAEDLQNVLGYHVLKGSVLYSDALSDGMTAATELGEDVTFRREDGAIFVNSARVVVGNVLIANGVVHFIDNVLNPANVAAKPDPALATQAPAYSGASATGGIPFTTGITPPASTEIPPATATITVGPGGTPVGAAGRQRAGLGVVAILCGAAVLFTL
ncbi:hypothetical protein OQA88_4391 [Cercophora sp. LCS_1]